MCIYVIYLMNLPMHTVNILLQKLIMLKVFILLLLRKHSILFTSCVNISQQYLGYYAKYGLFNLKGSISRVTKLEFRPKIILKSLRFSEAILISFVMMNDEKHHFYNKNCMQFTVVFGHFFGMPKILPSLTKLLPKPEKLNRWSYDGFRCPHEWPDVYTIRPEFEHFHNRVSIWCQVRDSVTPALGFRHNDDIGIKLL